MCRTIHKIGKRLAGGAVRLPVRLHRDERGTMSIVAVFAVMLLTMLLGMVMNVGRQVDGKIRMQNSADAVAYSGALVLTRGMNGLAYTNHLLCETFALTAIMREARDRNAESYAPDILAAWVKVAPVFSKSPFWKFSPVGPAATQKAPLEQEAITAFSDWAAKYSEYTLPIFEMILEEELIPKYQQSLFEAFPEMAQTAAMEAARRNGRARHGRGEMYGAVWRTYPVEPVNGPSESADPSLPVYDPMSAATDVVLRARDQRNALAHKYLNDWNNEVMYAFDHYAKMSQFGRLWRGFTCGYLEHLLKVEYPDRNLPFVIRTEAKDVMNSTAHLEEEFTFVGVAYWKRLPEMMPGLFKNPMEGDSVAYAQTRIFVPYRRLVWHWHHPSSRQRFGGLPGHFPPMPNLPESSEPADPGYWFVGRQWGVAEHWDLWNQHWTCQLVPTTTPALVDILQTQPDVPNFGTDIRLPNLGGLTTDDVNLISPH